MNRLQSTNVRLMRSLPVLALAMLSVLVAVALGALGSAQRGASLTGIWTAVPAEGDPVQVRVPVDFARVGLPTEEPVALQLRVELRDQVVDPAVMIEYPRHALSVWWDGREIGASSGGIRSSGSPGGDRPVFPLGVPMLSPGDHELVLVVQGAHGTGGIGGDVRIGGRSSLQRYAGGQTAARLALSAMLALTSLLGLVIASVRPTQREFFWFGVFCASAMIAVFSGDDAWWLVSEHLDLRMRLRTASALMLPGTGALFLHHLLWPSRREAAGVLTNAGLVFAGVALFWPDLDLQVHLRTLADLLAVGGLAIGAYVLVRAMRAGTEGGSALALAVGVLGGAAVLERVSVELGQVTPHLLLPAFLLFIGTASAAMVLHSTDLADRYRQLVSSARDLILVVLPDGTIEEGNRAAETILGQDFTGRPLSAFLRREDAATIERHLAGGEGSVRRAELVVQPPTRPALPVESVATGLPDGRSLLVMRDLTARRNAEEGLLHAARMETVGIIAGGIAHDFNNTMTALMAHIGLLKLKVEEKDKQRLDRMEAVIRRAAHMTRRLLTLARGGDKQRRPVNPAEPVHSAVELTRSMLPSNVQIKERVDPDLPRVLGSSDDLEQAVLNLLVNARDALAGLDGGTIRVRIRYHREADLPAAVRIIVEDDGPGIPAAVRASVWEPFFTTKGEGRGTGLGLSVVTRIIREHGGTIEYQDRHPDARDGRIGARFVITLPSARDVSAERLPADSGGRGRRVLVVDDEQEIRALLRAELQNRGYAVTEAASGEEALAAAVSADPPFEILLTDVVMGDLDGVELARRLCEADSQLRVVICSGFIPEHADALEPDWQRVHKPFKIEEVATALRRAMLDAEPDEGAPR
ncbi:MAG: response regulator [Alphaproteobacteria bacterium]|nr:response regulator [Alphaproteobacteria bacterium]